MITLLDLELHDIFIKARRNQEKQEKNKTITIKALRSKLLSELRLTIYLKNSFEKPTAYELGKEDTTRHVLVLLGFDEAKLMTVESIDILLEVKK